MKKAAVYFLFFLCMMGLGWDVQGVCGVHTFFFFFLCYYLRLSEAWRWQSGIKHKSLGNESLLGSVSVQPAGNPSSKPKQESRIPSDTATGEVFAIIAKTCHWITGWQGWLSDPVRSSEICYFILTTCMLLGTRCQYLMGICNGT